MSSEKQMKPRRKMGKTLLVSTQRNTDSVVDSSHFSGDKLKGLQKTTEKDGKFFLLFEDYSQAKEALHYLRKEFNYFVKFVHYKIFFKCSQLESETPNEEFEHNTFKNAMRTFVQSNTNGHVLYPPRLYRTTDKTRYVGCGNITVDTKESEDALLSSDGDLKNSKLCDKYEITFYRFRAQRDMNDNGVSNGVSESL